MSMSRGSSRSLVTSRSVDKNGGGGSNMKCIITIGILLPLLAAIIGIAAWSVSSESVHRRSPTSSLYHSGRSAYRDHFEERNDEADIFSEKVPIGGAVSKDVLGPALDEERDILPPANETPLERDPLYVVHYVPRGPQDATSEPPVPSPPPDVLSKILQSSKGTGKGTPQFVVFAPTLHEDDADDRSMQVSRKRTKKRKKVRKDYEYDDEYPENTQVKNQVTAVPRNYFDNSDYQQNNQGWTQYAQQHQNHPQPQPCCGGGGGHGMMPTQSSGGMMPTEAPKNGITISLGQVPIGPLGILRQLLRPKIDLKKKLFFGVQLENGIGFGGDHGGNAGGQMKQMNQGNMGHMGGGNMGHMGGGNMGHQGGGGGLTYTFG